MMDIVLRHSDIETSGLSLRDHSFGKGSLSPSTKTSAYAVFRAGNKDVWGELHLV